MGLETPLALLGLAAALLPWLAHRIRRRDLVPVALPTFVLLQQAEAKKRRSRGLTDLLLLALRIAIVVVACVCIAVPYATARLSFGDGTVTSAAIVIDDSLSMTRTDASETLLAQAVQKAQQAIASLPKGSEIVLVAGGAPARLLLRRTSDLALAQRELGRLATSSARGADMASAVRIAAEQLQHAKLSSRRLMVISDFAKHVRLEREDLQIEGIDVTLERLGARPPPTNLYFTALRATPAEGEQTAVAIELGAYGEAPERVRVTAQSAEQETSVEVTLTQGHGSGTLSMPTPRADGDPTALLRIDTSDAIASDNVAGVLLRETNALQVMLVNGDPRPTSVEDELHYLQLALRIMPDAGGSFVARAIDADTFGKYDLAHVDVVVLANVTAPDEAIAQRLIHFVKQGGGLVIAGGDHVQPRQYNAALAEVLPCKLRARTEGEMTLSAPRDDRLLPVAASGLTQARVRKRLMLDCGADVYLRFSDGSAAVAAADVARGRSALLATTLDGEWGDLPLHPGYLPLVSKLIRNVARAERAITGPVAALATVDIAVPPGASRLEVLTPEGERHAYDVQPGQATLPFAHTASPGPYRVLAKSPSGLMADVPRGAFVVTSPLAESDLTPQGELSPAISQTKKAKDSGLSRRPLTSWFLIAFAMLALAEGIVRVTRLRR